MSFDFYNGAMSTGQCHRLASAIRHAAAQDTKVLVISGGETFSNGIHLNVIEAAADPAAEAWRNINAIDDVCREIIECPKLVVAAVGGNAGAGGVMLALGADRVLLRDGVVLNPHYQTMGLFGSEYWTYVLPRRIGEREARELTERCLPIGANDAIRSGLADEAIRGNRVQFDEAVTEYAAQLAHGTDGTSNVAAKVAERHAHERRRPLLTYRVAELAEMSLDIFDDRNGFAAARRAFVDKQPSVQRARGDHRSAAQRARLVSVRDLGAISSIQRSGRDFFQQVRGIAPRFASTLAENCSSEVVSQREHQYAMGYGRRGRATRSSDFFWALVLMRTGDKRPITSALNNLSGQFFTDTNLLAAGSVLIALPTLIIYFALQRHFVRGLTLGSTKG